MNKKSILILCTGNSCRSQIAEGYLRHFAGDQFNVYSAGIETHGVNPKAIRVMEEDGIDISQHESNHIDEFKNFDFDYVITVCDHAREQCPVFPGEAQQIHRNFKDPAKSTAIISFYDVRDKIKSFIKSLISNRLLYSR